MNFKNLTIALLTFLIGAPLMAQNTVSSRVAQNLAVVRTQYSEPVDVRFQDTLGIRVEVDVQSAAADAFISGNYIDEVQTVTFDTKANTASGDWIQVFAQDGTDFAFFADKTAVEVATATFETLALSDAGDTLVVYDGNGLAWGMSIDKTGTDAEPTGIDWAGIPDARKVHVDISAATTAAQVAAAVELAVDALSGFSSVITTDDSAANGTMIFTQVIQGNVTNPKVKNANGSGAGGLLVSVGTPGTDATPTAEEFLAVPSARRARVNLNAATTAAQVAAAFEAVMDAVSGFTDLIATDDSAADGTMLLTQEESGPTTDPVVGDIDEAAAGSIVAVETTPGFNSDLDLDTDTIYLAAHAFKLGQVVRATTSGTLPTGIAVTTDYYVIVVDADHIQLATSLANAIAGTEIDFTALGDGTQTLTPEALSGGDIQVQECMDSIVANCTWLDVASKNQTVTVDVNSTISISAAPYHWVRLEYGITKGLYVVTSAIIGGK